MLHIYILLIASNMLSHNFLIDAHFFTEEVEKFPAQLQSLVNRQNIRPRLAQEVMKGVVPIAEPIF